MNALQKKILGTMLILTPIVIMAIDAYGLKEGLIIVGIGAPFVAMIVTGLYLWFLS